MATVKHAIAEHDFVALTGAIGKWPAGTTGTVVSDYGDVKLVEIAEDRPPGQMLDLIQVPEAGMRLVTKHSR